MKRRRSLALIVAVLATGILPAAAAEGSPLPVSPRDPYERFNRRIFAFNEAIDRALIKPAARLYVKALPETLRNGIRHVVDNLNEPVVFLNCLFQGRLKAAGHAGGRFVVNSTIGLAGLSDAATRLKMPAPHGDFGQTLWTWGFRSGPYLILPVLGPSSPRDGIGAGIDGYLDPFLYVGRHCGFSPEDAISRRAADGIDERARALEPLDEMKKEAIDYYASFRSLYQQYRAAEISGMGKAPTLPPPDFYSDPGS